MSRLFGRLSKRFVGSVRRRSLGGTSDSSPRVSVVINTLNRSAFLEEALHALCRVDYPHFEVVVVDGPSIDGTWEMLAAWSYRTRLAKCDVACLGVSRNVGLEMAAGEIVAFLDDDAIPPADWLSQLVSPYSDPDVAAVGGPVFDIPLDRIEWKLCVATRLGQPTTDAPWPIEQYLGVGADPFVYLAGCNMSFRRDILREIGGFNSQLGNVYDDVEVCSRIVDRGYRIVHNQRALVRHERAPNAIRDDKQVLTDPYPVVFARSVFALHCIESSHSSEEIADVMLGWVDEWRNIADHHVTAGDLSRADRDVFAERARQGAIDGLASGRRPRPIAPICAPPVDSFLPFM